MEAALKMDSPGWGAAALIRPGETECGDRYVVHPFEGGVLVALIDALGHGHDAAQVADVAARLFEQNAAEAPVSLLRRCHVLLRSTRGATISLASFDWRRQIMTWIGVGNVAGVLMSVDPRCTQPVESLLVRAGVVGDHMPELSPSVIQIGLQTTLILATDGVRRDFSQMLPSLINPQQLAAKVLDRYATHGDDATVLVFRCSESPR